MSLYLNFFFTDPTDSDTFISSSATHNGLKTAITSRYSAVSNDSDESKILTALDSSSLDDIYQGLNFISSKSDNWASEDELFIRSLAIVAFEGESDRSSVVSRLKALINSNVDRKTAGLTEDNSASPLILERLSIKKEANASALENMFSGGIPEGYSAEELARLKEIDKMVSADSKVNLKDAVDAYQTQ